MKVYRKFALSAATAALAIVPAAALAQGPGGHGPSGNGQSHSSNAKKYGKYCQGESKQHVDGQKGTPFSNCVNDMAKLAHNSNVTPRQACANESKQHVTGQKGTPYSLCVSGGAKLRHSQS
jgi:hypothetical protein